MIYWNHESDQLSISDVIRLPTQKRSPSAFQQTFRVWIWRVENQTKLQIFTEKKQAKSLLFLCLCVYAIEIMWKTFFSLFCSFFLFFPRSLSLHVFFVDSSENILYHAIMQGVLEINSWIETYGNLFIDFNSF